MWEAFVQVCLHARVPVLHESVHPNHSSGEEDSSHADIKARQWNFCCRQVPFWIHLYHVHLQWIHLSKYVQRLRFYVQRQRCSNYRERVRQFVSRFPVPTVVELEAVQTLCLQTELYAELWKTHTKKFYGPVQPSPCFKCRLLARGPVFWHHLSVWQHLRMLSGHLGKVHWDLPHFSGMRFSFRSQTHKAY